MAAKPAEEKKEKKQSSTYSGSFFAYSGPSLSDQREKAARRIYHNSTHHENFSRQEWLAAYNQAVKQVKW